MKLEVELYCPPMKIFKTDDPRVRVTDVEPMEFTGRLSNETFKLAPIVIEPTLIDKIGRLHWKVRACVGYGWRNGLEVVSNLPAEDTRWWWSRFGIYAEEMKAPTDVRLPDGRRFHGVVTYPEVRLGVLDDMTVPALTATGTLDQVQ